VKFHYLNRVLHRWGSIIIALPVLIVISTGLLLQVKKQVAWVQPPTQRGTGVAPSLPFNTVLEIASTVKEAEIRTWEDIDRLDVRPGKGMLKVRANNRWEIQIDAATGEILQVAYRRSDLIESLHDGSFFHDRAKLWVFLPSGMVLLAMWCTGIYLFTLPYQVKRNRRRREAERAERQQHERDP
jgi:uncharacterized iron-regulated membrane protein